MSTNGTPLDWKATANSEDLLKGIPPKRLATIEMLLAKFPDDSSRLIFLRWTNEMSIAPDSGLVLQMLMLMGVVTTMVEARLKNEFGNVREIVTQVERAAEQVAGTTIQVLDRSHHLKNHTEQAVQRIDATVADLVKRTDGVFDKLAENSNTVITKLDEKITQIAQTKVSEAVAEELKTGIAEKTNKVVSQLDEVTRGVGQLSDHLRTVAKTFGDMKANEPLIIAGRKINKTLATFLGVTATIALVVGLLAGRFLLPAPATVTLTPDMVVRFQQGAAFQRWYQNATPAERTAADREFAAQAAAAAHDGQTTP